MKKGRREKNKSIKKSELSKILNKILPNIAKYWKKVKKSEKK